MGGGEPFPGTANEAHHYRDKTQACMHSSDELTGHIDLEVLQFSRVGWHFWSGHSCVMTASKGETQSSCT